MEQRGYAIEDVLFVREANSHYPSPGVDGGGDYKEQENDDVAGRLP